MDKKKRKLKFAFFFILKYLIVQFSVTPESKRE